MWETILDPANLKAACGVTALIYGIACVAISIAALIAKASSLRSDSRILAPILATVAIALALVEVEFPRASQTLLPILYPSVVLALGAAGIALIVLAACTLKQRATRVAALVAAAIPIATSGVLTLIGYMLAHSRFCC